MIRVALSPRGAAAGMKLEYERLAEHFTKLMPKKSGILAEIGCGEGQLTVPLSKRLPGWSFRVVDNFGGSYAGGRSKLLRNLSRGAVKRQVTMVVSDYRKWLRGQQAGSYDAVISSEFFPELDSAQTRTFLRESRRILKPRGIAINSFLSPIPRNKRQRLLVEADSNPKWTKDPPKEWFSPTPEFVAKSLRQAGFIRVKTSRLKTGLIVRADAAQLLLKSWDVRPSFWNENRTVLERHGLELPDWIITTGEKPTTRAK